MSKERLVQFAGVMSQADLGGLVYQKRYASENGASHHGPKWVAMVGPGTTTQTAALQQ